MHLFTTSRLDERVAVAPTVMHASRMQGNTYSDSGVKRAVETCTIFMFCEAFGVLL